MVEKSSWFNHKFHVNFDQTLFANIWLCGMFFEVNLVVFVMSAIVDCLK